MISDQTNIYGDIRDGIRLSTPPKISSKRNKLPELLKKVLSLNVLKANWHWKMSELLLLQDGNSSDTSTYRMGPVFKWNWTMYVAGYVRHHKEMQQQCEEQIQ